MVLEAIVGGAITAVVNYFSEKGIEKAAGTITEKGVGDVYDSLKSLLGKKDEKQLEQLVQNPGDKYLQETLTQTILVALRTNQAQQMKLETLLQQLSAPYQINVDHSPVLLYQGLVQDQSLKSYELDNILKELEAARASITEIDAKRLELAHTFQLSEEKIQNTLAELEKERSKLKGDDALNYQLRKLDEEREFAAAQDLILRRIKERDKALAKDYFQMAGYAKLQLKYKDALGYYERAIELDEGNPLYLNDTAVSLNDLGFPDKAIILLEKALIIAIELYGIEHSEIATRYSNLGLAWDNKGEYDKAIDFYQRALKIDIKASGEVHSDVAIDYNNLGSAWSSKGEYDIAIGYYEQALLIDKEIFGELHSDIAVNYNNLGSAWNSKGEYQKAIEYYEQALKIDKAAFGETHPDIGIDYNNLALAWQNKGEYDKAMTYMLKAASIFEDFLSEDHPNMIAVRANMASIQSVINIKAD